MKVQDSERQTEIVREVAARAKRKVGRAKGAAAEQFVRAFYSHTPREDLVSQPKDKLLSMALSIWRALQSRKPDTPSIRIFNPRKAAHGWDSDHTVIEIIQDDMPFLVDSITAELNRHNLTVHRLVHPVIGVRRTKSGKFAGLTNGLPLPDDAQAESVMHVEINEIGRQEALDALESDLARVLADVRAAVSGWRQMRAELTDTINEINGAVTPSIPVAEVKEAEEFLRWMDADHFTFLGYREYTFPTRGKNTMLEVVPKSGIGLLRDPKLVLFEGMVDGGALPADIADFLKAPRLLMISKANRLSTVHRGVHLDTVGVKRFDKKGRIIGQRLFAGLFTSTAYSQATAEIPVVRRKVTNIVERAGLPPTSHSGKALLHILETLPRDELLQVDEDILFETALGILHLQERQRVALFVHPDPFQRWASCLVFVPRDRFNTALRRRMQTILEKGFNGKVTANYTQLSDELLARLQFIVRTTPGEKAPSTPEEIEHALAEAARDWSDDLGFALMQRHGEARGLEISRIYGNAFPGGYREKFAPEIAATDIDRLETVRRLGQPTSELFRTPESGANEIRFKLFNRESPVPLSDVLPVLEHMGLKVIDEVPHEIVTAGEEARIWLHDFGMFTRSHKPVDFDAAKQIFEEAFAAIWAGEVDDDGFNALVLTAGLTVRQIVILRAYCKYLRQAAIPFSQDYMAATLAENPAIARLLVALFETRFDPAGKPSRDKAMRKIEQQIEAALDAVSDVDQDRILRRYLNVIVSSLRTNYYQTLPDGTPKPYLSLKIDSALVEELPLPKPALEVFVYSPRVEAVHLRGGKVARGGIRWSDRREDFRTEILGLMKAQMTKNAVIVPVGAKGGFVVKRPPAGDREALLNEGIACYRTFMSGLLDITDNLSPDSKIIPPDRVVRHDGDDPYLVVAADKGTATFSDIANGIAAEYGFWLDDAFASGGSAGYDHKKMGITARGAWESVKRHFREIGIDTQTTPFTVIGIGDMGGDVFGNGMLRSKHIKLVGAFNHLHIFIDPDPDPGKSYAERARLFALPRSSWQDYNAKLISKGGGIFERQAKSIKVTPQMRALFGLPARDTIAPNDLIRAMLTAEIDLLWFGGIGTYVKSHRENNAEVGDRGNDSLRIDGTALRCKVVGEGANLGVTQRGRIEYALRGGRINTDFIDNSAGVGCSDHEVNIKILLGDAMTRNKLSRKTRDKRLETMTDEVAELVLMDNYRQTMALTHEQSQATDLLDGHARLMRGLERAGKLNRAVEYLPDDDTIAERRAARQGLTRPELAVLLAYAKIVLYEDLLASDLPDDPYLAKDIGLYFPKPLRTKFSREIATHRLQREISATYATNSLINRAGSVFIHETASLTGRTPAEIARAYLVTRDVFDMPAMWSAIEDLDNAVPAQTQTAMNLEILQLIQRSTQWFLRNERQPMDIGAAIESYRPGVAALAGVVGDIASDSLAEARDAKATSFIAEGVPAPLAQKIAALDLLAPACDIVRIAAGGGAAVEAVGEIYFSLGARFGLDWLRLLAEQIVPENEWQRMALGSVLDDFYDHQTQLVTRVLDAAGGPVAAAGVIDAWAEVNSHAVKRTEELLGELRAAGTVDLAMLTVANREFESLAAR